MSGMHRLFKGCLLSALLLALPGVSADQASDRERERERGDRRYEDGGYNGGNEGDDSRDCIEGRDDSYRGRDCDNDWVAADRYAPPVYTDMPGRRDRGGTADRPSVQPLPGSAYDGVGSGHREIDRGHSSSRQVQRGGGGGRR